MLLDCLGTLVRLEPAAPRLRAELAARGVEVSEAAAASAFRAEISYYLAHHLEGFDGPSLERLRDACARVTADELGVGTERLAAVRASMLAALRFHPYPDVADALRALRRAGRRLAVVSNWDHSLPDVLEAAGLLALVDAVVTSAEAGAAKPDPTVIEAALRAVDVRAAEAVLVGDSVENDVAAARAAGMAAILLERGEEERGGRPGASASAKRRHRGETVAGDSVTPVARSLGEVVSLVLARA